MCLIFFQKQCPSEVAASGPPACFCFLSLWTTKSQPVFSICSLALGFLFWGVILSVLYLSYLYTSVSLMESLKLPSLVCIHGLEVIGNGNSDRMSLKVEVFIFCFLVHCMFWRGKYWGKFKIRALSSFSIWLSIF